MTGDSVTVPEVAPYELHLIPLSRLRPSSRNVRQSGGTAIPELAASIARVGLLQNLTVITSPDGQWFEVVAGRRRLKAQDDGRLRKVRSSQTEGPKLRASRAAAVDAWVQIGLALAGSDQATDRQLAKHIASFVRGVTDSNKAADAQTKPERPQESRQHPTPQTEQQQTRQQPTPSTDIHPTR
ncbi:ParB N-terminal domain-containing protein [Hydrogenophaga sp. NH-16]|uniref:ParB/RepB/Spo0J family partition protein n=1 Tax=Hydrogenophaga sp. NH-16 TaxID=2184519 RepID=UPI00240D1A64|nr:ParB N-terminal domain-containing protein [Hydrogenophaga sp. NH-16]